MSSVVAQVSLNCAAVRRRHLSAVVACTGGRISTSLRLVTLLGRTNARFFTSFLLSGVTDSMGSQFISLLAVTAVAEYGRNHGYHLQAAYDDLSKHAVAYRQMCLFLRKPAGREAYPSDVFFLHARLLERSCNLGRQAQAGSLMSLPVIETLNNDLSAYIATNVISITDGQLYLDLTLFGVGQCPAVSVEKSVSRVGAKSLDSLSRSSAFALYTLLGSVRQEAELAVKSAGYASRQLRCNQFLQSLVQRSCQAKYLSTQLLFAIHTGWMSCMPTSVIPLMVVFFQNFDLSAIGLMCHS